MPSSGGATASPEDGRHFCFIKSVTRTGAAEITVDYAEFLTGQAAADAASADGEESPPPNDFYISNKNPKLRTFPVNKSMKVKMVSKADDIVMQGYRLPFSAWRDAFNGGAGSFPAIKVVPYWITIQLGVVTAIEEQYIP